MLVITGALSHQTFYNIGVFPKWAELSLSLAGAVVGSWSLTQEVAGSSPFTIMTYILSLNSANSVKHLGKTPVLLFMGVYLVRTKRVVVAENS